VAVLQFIYLNQSILSNEKSINAYANLAGVFFCLGVITVCEALFNPFRISGLHLAVYGYFRH